MRLHLAILILTVFLAACSSSPAAIPTQQILPTLPSSATPPPLSPTIPTSTNTPTETPTVSPMLYVTLTRQSINTVLTELAPTVQAPTALDTPSLTPPSTSSIQPIAINQPQIVPLAITAPVEFVYTGSTNETVTITVRSLAAPGDIDPVMQIFDPAGELLATNDDHDSTHTNLYKLDAALDDLVLPNAGDYRIHIDTPYRQGNIEVLVSKMTAIETVAEQTDDVIIVTDTLAVGQHYQYPITASYGEILTILLHAEPDTFDPYLALLGEDGQSIIGNNDDHDTDYPELAERDSALEDMEIPAEGNYIIEVSDFYDEAGGNFELTIIYQQDDESQE